MAWYVTQAPMAGALSYLHEFLMQEFERIFGREIMHMRDCTIYNDPQSKGPYCYYEPHVRIRLAQESLDYWAQTVFQLSHEMTHYACLSVRGLDTPPARWYEEIFCEAMSLYFLEYAATNWSYCWLSRINPSFDASIRDYLNVNYNDAWSEGLASCRTHAALLTYDRDLMPERRRDGHVRERNKLYLAIRQNPTAAGALVRYSRYLCAGGVLVDFASWQRAERGNPLIPLFASLQPVK